MTLKERLQQIKDKVAGIVVKTGVTMPAIFDSSTGLIKSGSAGRPNKPNSMKGIDELGKSLTAHHLTPWNQLRDEVNEALKKNTAVKLLKIFTKEGVSFESEVKDNFSTKDQAFYQALARGLTKVCWNPSNVFMGPISDSRGDDPGEKIDVTFTDSGMQTASSALTELKDKLKEAKGATGGELDEVLLELQTGIIEINKITVIKDVAKKKKDNRKKSINKKNKKGGIQIQLSGDVDYNKYSKDYQDAVDKLEKLPPLEILGKLKAEIEAEKLKRKNAKDKRDLGVQKRAEELNTLKEKEEIDLTANDLKRIAELEKIQGAKLDREISKSKDKIKDQEETKALYVTYLKGIIKEITLAETDKKERNQHLNKLEEQLEIANTNLLLLMEASPNSEDLLGNEKTIHELNASVLEQKEQLGLVEKNLVELKNEKKEIEGIMLSNEKNKVDYSKGLQALETRKSNKTALEITALEKHEDNEKLEKLMEGLEQQIVEQGITKPRPYNKDDWTTLPNGKKVQIRGNALHASLEAQMKVLENTKFSSGKEIESEKERIEGLIKDWKAELTSFKVQKNKLALVPSPTDDQIKLLAVLKSWIVTKNEPQSYEKRLSAALISQYTKLILEKILALLKSKVKFLAAREEVELLLAKLKAIKASEVDKFKNTVNGFPLVKEIIDKIDKKDKTVSTELAELKKIPQFATIYAELLIEANDLL